MHYVLVMALCAAVITNTIQFYSYDLMLKCWREKPDERPSFKNIVTVLTTMTENQDDQVLSKSYGIYIQQNIQIK